ncbi:MAG: hypothetical protein PHE89_03125 [Alphaproteobacteria bacterium]|nr:hypothetical protein [Alphaproteobacteria bacterium]
MKKLFIFISLAMIGFFAVSCSNTNTTTPKEPVKELFKELSFPENGAVVKIFSINNGETFEAEIEKKEVTYVFRRDEVVNDTIIDGVKRRHHAVYFMSQYLFIEDVRADDKVIPEDSEFLQIIKVIDLYVDEAQKILKIKFLLSNDTVKVYEEKY